MTTPVEFFSVSIHFCNISRDDRSHDLIARELAHRAPRVESAHVIGDRNRFAGREHREMRRDLVRFVLLVRVQSAGSRGYDFASVSESWPHCAS